MHRPRVIGVALVACVLTAGCERSLGRLPWQHGLTFEQFVQTTVELRRAVTDAPSPAAFQARKQAIEKRLGVTDAELQRYVQDHARDVKLMSAAWDSVEARLGRAGEADAATHPTPQPPPAGASGPPPGAVPPPGTKMPPGKRPRPRF